MVRDILRLDLAVISILKHLNRVEKISNCVVMNSAKPEGFTVHVIFGVNFYVVK